MAQSKLALITGATSGIGKEFAFIHAQNGGDLFIVARREAELQKIKAEIKSRYKVRVHTHSIDLSLPDAAQTLFSMITAHNLEIDILINNAGVGGLGEFQIQSLQSYQQMIHLNITTLTELTRLILPQMLKRNSGRILNVASIAGFVPGPYHAVYYASKAYVLSLSEALSFELRESAITVTALCPGPTESEFFSRAGVKKSFANKLPSSKEVAEFGYNQLINGEVVAIPKFSLRMFLLAIRLMPRKLIVKLSGERAYQMTQ